jgi:hypothetical protein
VILYVCAKSVKYVEGSNVLGVGSTVPPYGALLTEELELELEDEELSGVG